MNQSIEIITHSDFENTMLPAVRMLERILPNLIEQNERRWSRGDFSWRDELQTIAREPNKETPVRRCHCHQCYHCLAKVTPKMGAKRTIWWHTRTIRSAISRNELQSEQQNDNGRIGPLVVMGLMTAIHGLHFWKDGRVCGLFRFVFSHWDSFMSMLWCGISVHCQSCKRRRQ